MRDIIGWFGKRFVHTFFIYFFDEESKFVTTRMNHVLIIEVGSYGASSEV